MTVTTESAGETEMLGECLGSLLVPGDVVTLSGELGAGKSRFAQGVAYGLGVQRSTPVTSPTYTILNEYPGRTPFYHFDFYRFLPGEELRDLGFEEQFAGSGVCLVEWPERLAGELAREYLEIKITVEGESRREITLSPHGAGYEEKVLFLLETVKKCFDPDGNSCY
jgi:tRNA threonylcarbamoyladenosine biosynthesis protein TsaE